MGYRNPKGYGQIGNKPFSSMELAHRVAFIASGGVLTSEKPHVLHGCDNPPCCNYHPKHLRAGSHAENMAECKAKGRNATGDKHGTKTHPERHGSRLHPESHQGERHPRAKLTTAQVVSIRSAYESDSGPKYGKMARIARQYGVEPVTIQAIIARRNWKHVA
jgi:hypothetical protein